MIKIKRDRAIRFAALVFFGVLAVVSLINIGKILAENNKGDSTYDSIAQIAVVMPEDNTQSEGEYQVPQLPSVDFSKLEETNEETIGWVYSEGTKINYPVVQGKDNEKYLTTLFNSRQGSFGTVFADYRCSNDTNIVLYGHNMKNGSMFASLTKYKKQSYFDKHKTILYITKEGAFEISLVAGLVVDAYDTEAIPLYFSSVEEFNSYISKCKSRSTFNTDTSARFGDRLAILATCSYENDNSRYMVVGTIKPTDSIE